MVQHELELVIEKGPDLLGSEQDFIRAIVLHVLAEDLVLRGEFLK